jgi:hypothetical protein
MEPDPVLVSNSQRVVAALLGLHASRHFPTLTQDVLFGCASGGVIRLTCVAHAGLQLSQHPQGE